MVKFNVTVSKSSTGECNLHKTIKSPRTSSRQGSEESGVKELISKLRSVLPTTGDELSTLDIMQNAIYYIHDLNDILAQEKPTISDDEKENQRSFCQSDLFSVNEVFSEEKQQRFPSNCQNGFHSTAVF